MATVLYRLGRWSMRMRWVVLVAWLAILGTVGGLAVAAGGGSELEEQLSIPGTESAQAQDVLAERFGDAFASQASDLTGSDPTTPATARILLAAPEGAVVMDPAVAQQAGAFLAQVAAVDGVTGVSDPFTTLTIAPDGSALYADVQLADPAPDVPVATLDALESVVDDAEAAGWRAAVSGGPFLDELEIISGAESIGVVVALVVLLVTFGSLLAAGMPILTALIGVAIGAGGIIAVSSVVDVSSATLALALMLGLAVGIDYALFILSRYRTHLSDGLAPLDAVGRAVGTAGSAVVFAGFTVIIASAGLAVVGIPFLGIMGVAAAATVAVAVLIAITLLPALLGFAGTRLTPRGARAVAASRRASDGEAASADAGAPVDIATSNRWGTFTTGHPVLVLVLGVALLGTLAIPALDLRLGLPDSGRSAPGSHSRVAYDLQADTFGPGFNGPLVVLVDLPGGGAAEAAAAVADQVSGLAGVALVAPPVPNATDDAAIVTVIPTAGPMSAETSDLVHAIRAERADLEDASGADITVTGVAAANIDISEKLASALPVFLLLVVGLALLLLLVAFRSILVPVTAVVGFLLSVAASFGATTAVYQWGWLSDVLNVSSPGPLISFLPVLLVGVLFGLAMDYQVFLVSRMREDYVHGATPRRAVLIGFAHGSRVVLAAAVIMIAVFGAFVFGGSVMIAPIAFALGMGILVDALVVRMTLIPAVMTLLGASAWWLPRWLDRAIPSVDIEGERLTHHLAAEAAEAAEAAGEAARAAR